MSTVKHTSPFRLIAALALILGLTGCETAQGILGLSKRSPDESGVTVFSPLVVPPDFNLRPPRDGGIDQATAKTLPRRPRQQAFITDDGRVIGGATGTEQVPGDTSVGELALLRQAGALTPPAGVRGLAAQQELAATRLNRVLTDVVLFNRSPADQRKPQKRELTSIERQGLFF